MRSVLNGRADSFRRLLLCGIIAVLLALRWLMSLARRVVIVVVVNQIGKEIALDGRDFRRPGTA